MTRVTPLSPPPGIRLITIHDSDPACAAEALLVVLRPAPQPDTHIANPARRNDPDTTDVTAEDPAVA
jgi:hypothetical protein